MTSNIVLSTKEFNVVGKRPVRHDGVDKVTGKAAYGADIDLPGMLHFKLRKKGTLAYEHSKEGREDDVKHCAFN